MITSSLASGALSAQQLAHSGFIRRSTGSGSTGQTPIAHFPGENSARTWLSQLLRRPRPQAPQRDRVTRRFRICSFFLLVLPFIIVLMCLPPASAAARDWAEAEVPVHDDNHDNSASRPEYQPTSGSPREVARERRRLREMRPDNLPYPFGTLSSRICDNYARRGIFLERCFGVGTGRWRPPHPYGSMFPDLGVRTPSFNRGWGWGNRWGVRTRWW